MIHMTYELLPADAQDPPSIKCLICGLRSFHPKDVEKRYCGNCHSFHRPMRTPVLATIAYVTGLKDTWAFDLDDRGERIDFARRADAALRRGATVTTRRCSMLKKEDGKT